MSTNLRIAFRFLTARKRSMLMSLSCIVLGVGLFIVTQATTRGFQEVFIRTLLGTNGAIRIQDRIQDTMRGVSAPGAENFWVRQREGVRYVEGVEDPRRVMAAVREYANVRGVSAVLQGSVQLASSFRSGDAQLYGINIDDHLRASDFERHIVAGSLEKFRASPWSVIVGRVIADRLQLAIDDWLVINARGESRRYRVAAIFETGVRDIDNVRVYVDLTEARSLLQRVADASFVQVSLADPDRAPADARRMTETLGHMVTPWQIREKVWLDVFAALQVSSGIVVTVFTLIASLAMFNTLAMTVIEKTKDIAILRSMGYERRDITQIFLWQAAIVLAIGTVAGTLFGAGVTYAISRLPLAITGIFKTETFQVSWQWEHYLQAVITAVVMVMLASIVPARRAARLEPGDIVRGTAQ